MTESRSSNSLILGICIFLGLAALGYLLSSAAIKVKEYERTVTAKGLSEREYKADIVIWPIQFTTTNNDLTELYNSVESNTSEINSFLVGNGILSEEISFGTPGITDKSAQQYGSSSGAEFRYTAFQTVTVYSKNVDSVRELMSTLSELGKKGVVLSGARTEYLFTCLNEVKPEMIEEATKKAREVARKFATDSQSELGKIKRASQGQFSIRPRDKNNPHIKKIRVVATVEYYLSD